ncbi:MAG TPA: chemotaxis protein CheW [Anaeromyxobacter sp.]|nr:chemotaxis protein CheW [Anaeromyxobacter sp.]
MTARGDDAAPVGDDAAPVAAAAGREGILRQRARDLAQARETASADTVPLLPFEVGGERYAVEVIRVHQVLDARFVDPLLGAPRGVVGAIMARSRPVPVFDLRHLLGLEGGGLVDLVRVILVDDEGDLFGFAVESVSPTIEVPATELRPAQAGPFRWMAPGPIAVLDPARLGVGGGEGG